VLKDETTPLQYSYGEGMDQKAMMESDMLIAVDKCDNPIIPADLSEHLSKRKAHEFNKDQPRGVAHRAFSVFLFNEKDELLLTKRAESKITFPGVWTNTCCSHPIHHMSPSEVDTNGDYPAFPGIKHAAIRKLKHELGIEPGDCPHQEFRFLTRVRYWAADTLTYGQNAKWGEHEIDYILFIRCMDEPKLNINKEEVCDHTYISLPRLKSMMEEEGLKWSPWFRGIMENVGFEMWLDLDEALRSNSKYCNSDIRYFDPPVEHFASYNLPSHGQETGILKL